MGLMMRRRRRRRRALVAGAAVGGLAYHAGRNRGADDEAYAQDAQYDQAPPAPPLSASNSAAPVDTVTELKNLADLHASGALTDDEFTAAKSKLIGS